MDKNSKIYVAGHNGMVGSAIVRKLRKEGFSNILTASSKELNLISQDAVNTWFEANKPDYVFVAAARLEVYMQTIPTAQIFSIRT
jgi:GDP-L-fucose synthase